MPGPGRFLAEYFEILGLPEPDGELLLDGLRTLVHHHDDREPSTVRPSHALQQCLPDAAAAEILRLDVDEALGRADRVDEQALDLADAVALGEWLGPAERHASGAERKQPPGSRGWRSAGADERRWLTAAGTPPALPEQVRERAANIGARQVALYVVVRFVRHAAPEPQSVLPAMAAVVPARLAHVHAADEGMRAVDDDEFLVMRAARRRTVVEQEAEPRVRHPVEVHPLHPLPLEREHDVEVPREDVDVEVGIRLAERVQEGEKPHLRLGRRIAPTQQQHAAVELPARHEHVSPRCSRALVEGAIVVSRVDQNPGVECSRLPPGVPAEPDDRCYRFHRQSLADREKWSRGDARARRGRGRRGNGETHSRQRHQGAVAANAAPPGLIIIAEVLPVPA